LNTQNPSGLAIAATGAAAVAPVHDCWNTIGVAGNGSCRELTRHIHCRNCPVHAAAAVQLLDRPLSAEYRREWTEHFAREKTLTTPARVSVVTFRIGLEWLALRTDIFQEVAERRSMHSLPHRRRGIVIGLVNVRGELLICAALDRLLGLESAVPSPRHRVRTVFDRLLVSDWKGNRFAFPVDEVQGVHRLNQDEIHEAPATVSRAATRCSAGVFEWEDRTVGLLDAAALFEQLNQNLS
jgi:chemotaxis-related protein WspD